MASWGQPGKQRKKAPKFSTKMEKVPVRDSGSREAHGGRPSKCQYIYGDVDPSRPTVYCGNDAVPGKSYCEFHHQFLYTKPPEKKDDGRSDR